MKTKPRTNNHPLDDLLLEMNAPAMNARSFDDFQDPWIAKPSKRRQPDSNAAKQRPSLLPPDAGKEWIGIASDFHHYWRQLLVAVGGILALCSTLIYFDYQREKELQIARVNYYQCIKTLQSWSLDQDGLAKLGLRSSQLRSHDLNELRASISTCKSRAKELMEFMPENLDRAMAASRYLESIQPPLTANDPAGYRKG